MRVRQARQLLTTLSILLAIGAVIVIVAALYLPYDVVEIRIPRHEKMANVQETGSSIDAPSIEQLRKACSRPLRAQLVDPPKPKKETPKRIVEKKPPPPKIRLLATMVEPDNTWALFSTDKGRLVMRSHGERIGDGSDAPIVHKITSKDVVVVYRNQTITYEFADSEGHR